MNIWKGQQKKGFTEKDKKEERGEHSEEEKQEFDKWRTERKERREDYEWRIESKEGIPTFGGSANGDSDLSHLPLKSF